MNLILRTNDSATRMAFSRLAPRWHLIDPETAPRGPYVLIVDLRVPVDEAQFKTSRGWIALGDSPRHFQWAFERGATLFLMWPCGLKQLTDGVVAS